MQSDKLGRIYRMEFVGKNWGKFLIVIHLFVDLRI
jgi:hypothetical protein